MNIPTDDRLDRLLQEWAAAQTPGSDHLDALCRRISQAVEAAATATPTGPADAGPAVRPEAIAAPGAQRAWLSRAWWFGLGAAAAVTAAVLLWPVLRPAAVHDGRGQPLAAGLPAPPQVRLDGRQLAARAALYAEMRRVFGSDLAWLAETDGSVVLGLQPPGQTAPADSKPIAIRLLVMTRKPGQSEWRAQSRVDVILDDQEYIQFAPKRGPEGQVAFWAYRLPDGMIAVDTSLQVEGSGRPAASHSGIQRPEAPEQIFILRSGETEYRVFQTVAVLPEEVG